MPVCQNGILQRLQTFPSAPDFTLSTAISSPEKRPATDWVWSGSLVGAPSCKYRFCFSLCFCLSLRERFAFDVKALYHQAENDLSAGCVLLAFYLIFFFLFEFSKNSVVKVICHSGDGLASDWRLEQLGCPAVGAFWTGKARISQFGSFAIFWCV